MKGNPVPYGVRTADALVGECAALTQGHDFEP
jgi:hypothetical protein